MPGMFDDVVTLEEMRDCAKRELAMRESAYPRWIAANKMKPARAERELILMRKMLEHFEGACLLTSPHREQWLAAVERRG